LKVSYLLEEAFAQLKAVGKEDSLVDAEWLLCEVTDLTRTMLQLEGDRDLSNSEVKTFKAMMTQRLQGRPLQYILGVQSFYGYDFHVSEDVLIPRFETEELVDRAISWAKNNNANALIDMCTGSGCIGLTVLKECPNMSGVLVDYSEKALAVAKMNSRTLLLEDRVELVHSNLFESVPMKSVDLILSNPPYIVTDVVDTLDEEVKGSEPHMALDGGADGLDFYKGIGAEAKTYLRKEGLLMFEIGYDQKEAVMEILHIEGYRNIEGIKDLAGRDRMVLGTR